MAAKILIGNLRGLPGKDSTVPGPPGKDSTVPGPPGKDSTVPGPPGKDGKNQALSINGSTLSISDGNSVELPSGGPAAQTTGMRKVPFSAVTFYDNSPVAEVTGDIYLRRIGDQVFVNGQGDMQRTRDVVTCSFKLPEGFNPSSSYGIAPILTCRGENTLAAVLIRAWPDILIHQGDLKSQTYFQIWGSFFTDEPFPSEPYPGQST